MTSKSDEAVEKWLSKEESTALIERNKKEGWPDLPPQRRAFALRYIIDYDHRESAKEAGLNENYALKYIREPLTSAYISYLQEEANISNVITNDFIRTQFLNLIPMLSGQVEVPMIVGKDGDAVSAKKFHSNELISVLKELAKSTKFYEGGSGNMDSAAKTFAETFKGFMQNES
ncbi:hypothetical protein KAR91_47795 [Candidatus Pacearchaeota archaeon]|nr:hypothetical protein [Candidatus Pacearchaeota archaeon]